MSQVPHRSDSPRAPRGAAPASDRTNAAGWGRDLISLLLFFHVFCVAIVLSANLTPSSLQRRLVVLVAPYTRLLNFDPNFTRFQLTHGIEEHDDHVLEVVQAGQGSATETVLARFPDGTNYFRGGLPFGRYRNLSDMFAFHAYRELDDVTAELARAIGAHVIKRMSEPSAVVVRCRWHRAQPMDLRESGELNPADPQAPEYWETIYEADVFLDDDGSPQLVKRASRREVAPSRQGL